MNEQIVNVPLFSPSVCTVIDFKQLTASVSETSQSLTKKLMKTILNGTIL